MNPKPTPSLSTLIAGLETLVGAAHVYTDAKTLKVFSTDAHTFSPVLTEALRDKRADVVVAPGSVDELRAVLAYAVASGVPITLRGAGTGNYGQSVPLAGGVVVLTRRLKQILALDPETRRARVQPGVIIGSLERHARAVGLEVRCYPSTYGTATIGGFVGGGFGGVGSIRNGTLWDGMLTELVLLSAEAEPQTLTLRGDALNSVIHAYGVTGVISELELALVPSLPWEECVLAFETLEAALRFSYALAASDEFDKRLISLSEWPIPSFFTPLAREGGTPEGCAAVLLELAEGQREAALELAAPLGGRLSWSRSAAGYHKSRFSLSDFSWNHTTLWALKADASYTYLQAQFAAPLDEALAQVDALKAAFGAELPLHFEYIRQGGALSLSGLPLVYYRDATRLYELIAACEQLGVSIADPHTWRLDHDPRWRGAPVVAARAARNPTRLLNPGKLGAELPEDPPYTAAPALAER